MQARDCVPTSGLSRRSFLQGGALGLTCLPASLLRLQTPKPDAPAQAVIHIFLQGGVSHLDTFDPKPLAPVEYRGELKAIPSKIDGEAFSEVLARTAGIADRLTVIRSMTHTEAAHERGTHSMLTGYQPSPAITYPSFGAVVSLELGSRRSLPPYVSIPHANEIYLGTGYLSSAHGPFTPGSDPNNRNFRVRDLSPPGGVTRKRVARRKALVEAIDQAYGLEADSIEATEAFYQQAWQLIESKPAREAFRLDREQGKVRDAYGRTPIGQGLLLARRLVGAGVRYVTVMNGGWDHHRRIFPTIRGRMRAVDQAFAALIRDLEQRGMLDTTLVLLSTEFGRTPRVNRDAGRDHWPRVFSVVLAGAGIRRGSVYGSSNDVGSEVENDPVSPPDMAATLFAQLGIDPAAKLLSPGNRPINIVRGGRVLREILA